MTDITTVPHYKDRGVAERTIFRNSQQIGGMRALMFVGLGFVVLAVGDLVSTLQAGQALALTPFLISSLLMFGLSAAVFHSLRRSITRIAVVGDSIVAELPRPFATKRVQVPAGVLRSAEHKVTVGKGGANHSLVLTLPGFGHMSVALTGARMSSACMAMVAPDAIETYTALAGAAHWEL